MKVAVIGSRNFDDYNRVKRILDLYPITVIVSGGARGADSLGEKYANEKGLQKEIYVPQWDLFGKKAGFLRNTTIIENCDMVVVFWDGSSKGTKDSLDKAQALKKTTLIAYF
jgi:hypothetical protein